MFSATGGIEKVCRVAGKALYEMSLHGEASSSIYSMHDKDEDAAGNKYFPLEIFHGFAGKKLHFIFSAIKQGRKSNTVILSHINLILVGWLIKKISPSTRLIMFAHGIEVWELLSKRKKWMLGCCDQIFAVSNFTSEKMQEMHQVPKVKCHVLNNCLDPFLAESLKGTLNKQLRQKYGYKEDDIILFTLARLSSSEKYKGYDKVLQSMVSLKKTVPGIHYLLAGSYDEKEKRSLEILLEELNISERVKMAGFVKENDLVEYFSMADIYIMPSMKEGFGIVFIEAMHYGLPVIAGNKDGSVDALCNGKLGLLVNPSDVQAITDAVSKIIKERNSYIPNRELLMQQFGYENYKTRLEHLIKL